MIGLGLLPTLGNTDRLHELRLWASISRVDRTEAEQGAAHSDVVRLGSKSRNESHEVPLERYTSNRIRFRNRRDEKKKEPPKELEDDCPVRRARAKSLVGENAPLGWLVADHNSDDDKPQEALAGISDQLMGESEPYSPRPTVDFTLDEEEERASIFDGEWFLSPCG